MYSTYKSIVIILVLVLFGFSTIVFADPLTNLQISVGEETQYTVGEIIIIDNDNQQESYIIDSIDDGKLNLQKNIQNGFDMNVIQGTSLVYPLPVDFDNPGMYDDYTVLSYLPPIGSPAFINELNTALLEHVNLYSSRYYGIYAFLPNNNRRIEVYVYDTADGALPIDTLIKIYDRVGDNYVSRGANFVLKPIIDYANVNIGVSSVLILAGVVVVGLASIFFVGKIVKLGNCS